MQFRRHNRGLIKLYALASVIFLSFVIAPLFGVSPASAVDPGAPSVSKEKYEYYHNTTDKNTAEYGITGIGGNFSPQTVTFKKADGARTAPNSSESNMYGNDFSQKNITDTPGYSYYVGALYVTLTYTDSRTDQLDCALKLEIIVNSDGTKANRGVGTVSAPGYLNDDAGTWIDNAHPTTGMPYCSSPSLSQFTNVDDVLSKLWINSYNPIGITLKGTFGALAGGPETLSENKEAKTCGSEVSGVGWIVCPVLNALTKLNDWMWSVVSYLLNLNPLKQSAPIYAAWSAIRNLANVVFVVIFLIMIFSQISNFGIDNYGIKKLLPRLIVGAILVNLSFILMQGVVDLANIMGSGVYDLLAKLAPATPNWGGLSDLLLASGGIVAGAGGAAVAVVAVGGFGAAFLFLLPMAAVGALSLLAALLTLICRQAIVPILAILAPLAFVAYLLPNTETWFKKWRDLLINMLMLYPLAAIIFGGAKFASSAIISNGGFWNNLIGLVVLTVPLFSLPFLASKGGAITSAVSSRLQNIAKSAKAPLQKWTAPRIDEKKQERLAGSRSLFGRKLSDEKIAQRLAEGKRNMATRLNERNMRREQNTENMKGVAKENWRQRPLGENLADAPKHTQKAAMRAAGVLDASESLGIRKGANDAQYKERLGGRINTVGSAESQDDTRQRDSGFASEQYKKETDQRFTTRVNANAISTTGGGGLRDLSRRGFAADEEIKNQNLQIERGHRESGVANGSMREQFIAEEAIKSQKLQVERGNRESGVASTSIQEQKVAELGIKAVNDTEKATFDKGVLRNADTKASLDTITSAGLSSDASLAQQKLHNERLINNSPELKILREDKEDATMKSTGLEGRHTAEFEERKVTDPTLIGVENKTRAYAQSAQLAKGEQQRNYAEEVMSTTSSTIRDLAAGNVDTHGDARVQANATAVMDKAREENVSNAKLLFAANGYTRVYNPDTDPPSDLMNVVEGGRLKNGDTATIEDKQAAMQMLVDTGDFKMMKKLTEYVATLPPGATETLKTQQALGNMFNSSPKTPKGISGKVRGMLSTGQLTSPYNDLQYELISSGKISAQTFVDMDREEINNLLSVINDKGTAGLTPEVLKSLKDSIQQTEDDDKIRSNIPQEKRSIINNIKSIL